MREKLIELTKELINTNSVSSNSNKSIIEIFIRLFKINNFDTEEINYLDDNGVKKYNLVARKGHKSGGLAFLIHSDTVPLANNSQLTPYIEDGKLFGRGACDMKGPAAASILAGVEEDNLNYSLTYIITADEEIGCFGADFVVKNSKLLKEFPPKWGIATEPTELVPIYAHKGLCSISVEADGIAAHSSTSIGESANFKMIPFLYYISKLKEKYNNDKSYQNMEFNPPTNTLNLTISDLNCAPNVTPAKSICKICFRTMPQSKTDEIITDIKNKAAELGLSFSYLLLDSIHSDPESIFVKTCKKLTNREPSTVAYLTDACHFSKILTPIVLGPGSIKRAHTKGEYIEVDELYTGYKLYRKILRELSRI